jgi:hypothetical protein
MASPRPVPTTNDLISDDLQWEIMSRGSDDTNTVGPGTTILRWNQEVMNANIDEVDSCTASTGEFRGLPSAKLVADWF